MTKNVFTVDLEEWFHICGSGNEILRPENWDRLPSRVEHTTARLLDLLDRAGVRATWFVVGWVAERHPALIQRLRAGGHEIGSHSYLHQKVYDIGPEAFRHDLRRSLAAIESASGEAVTAFRAPEWSVNARAPWALELLVREGIGVDASMAPVKLVGDTSFPRYPHKRSTPAGPIAEVPPLVADRWGQVMPVGWGWALRMSSPRRVLTAIEGANAAGRPAVLTVHPWELDPDPPRVRLPLRLGFAHYFRLDGFAERLGQVVRGAAFGPIREMGPLPAEL